MSNIPVAAQTNLMLTGGRAWWGNRALSPIPTDPGEPEELCCDASIALGTPQEEAANCAIEQFLQSMATFDGTRDFICINPLPREEQPGWNPYTKSIDTSQPLRFEQPYIKQGLWDEEASLILIEKYGKRSDDILVVYFKEGIFLNESTVVKHLGFQFVSTNFMLEPFVGTKKWIKNTIEINESRNKFTAWDDRELEGRIFFTNSTGSQGDISNTYVLDPDNARVIVYDPPGIVELFDFGEDLSGFPAGSKYTDPTVGKWFKPSEIEVTTDSKLKVFDDSWQEWIIFSLDGIVEESYPVRRRR